KSPMWITPLPPSLSALGGKVHMAQFSMEIMRLTGSVLRGNQHSKTFQANLGNCGTQGFASPCGTNLETLAEHARNNPQLFAQEVHHIIGDAVADVLARYEPTLDGHAMSNGQSREFQESLATAYACAIAWSSLTGDPSFIRNLNMSLSSIDNQSGINAYRGMAGIVLEKIGPADPATGKGTPVDLAYVDDWMGQGISNEGELANRADRRTAAGIVLSGVVATPAGTQLAVDRVVAKILPDNVTVYRVEGAANQRLVVGIDGSVAIIGDNTLFLNFGNAQRAQDFFSKRITQGMTDVSVKTFKVPKSFLDELRQAAVVERQASQFPDAPIVVDQTKATDQFGLRKSHFEQLNSVIIQGSGRLN
ncbi:hypothetical protein, partial [Agrobacterium sp. P15N1-A]|uniref:hypothetical protein n=1 Tax=Agrobacterium sp. P15N1-A TaxID=3342820 RepID=UPI0037CF888E